MTTAEQIGDSPSLVTFNPSLSHRLFQFWCVGVLENHHLDGNDITRVIPIWGCFALGHLQDWISECHFLSTWNVQGCSWSSFHRFWTWHRSVFTNPSSYPDLLKHDVQVNLSFSDFKYLVIVHGPSNVESHIMPKSHYFIPMTFIIQLLLGPRKTSPLQTRAEQLGAIATVGNLWSDSYLLPKLVEFWNQIETPGWQFRLMRVQWCVSWSLCDHKFPALMTQWQSLSGICNCEHQAHLNLNIKCELSQCQV